MIFLVWKKWSSLHFMSWLYGMKQYLLLLFYLRLGNHLNTARSRHSVTKTPDQLLPVLYALQPDFSSFLHLLASIAGTAGDGQQHAAALCSRPGWFLLRLRRSISGGSDAHVRHPPARSVTHNRCRKDKARWRQCLLLNDWLSLKKKEDREAGFTGGPTSWTFFFLSCSKLAPGCSGSSQNWKSPERKKQCGWVIFRFYH